MAINIQLVNNVTGATKSIAVDFASEIVASSQLGVSNEMKYFFKFSTGALDTNGKKIQVKLVQGLDELALNGEKRSASNSSADYDDITTMVWDYVYDFVNGHEAGQYATSVREQLPMDL
jgi:hypothetical protein